MPVLIEGIAVVVKGSSIVTNVEGGIQAFLDTLPDRTWLSDGVLVCVHFRAPSDVQVYVECLAEIGLVYKGADGKAVDLVVVDQNAGLMIPCDWVEFGKMDWDNDPSKPVPVCYQQGHNDFRVVAPEGWRYEASLLASDGCPWPYRGGDAGA